MIKIINNYVNSSIITCILLILTGIIMIIFPKISLDTFATLISLLLIISGIYLVSMDIKTFNSIIPIDTLIPGMCSIIMGTILLTNPEILSIIIPFILGIWFIIDSIIKIRLSLILKNIGISSWTITLLLSIISIICSIILMINPTITSISLTVMLGIIIIVYSISGLIDILIFKNHINTIKNHFKKNNKIVIDYED